MKYSSSFTHDLDFGESGEDWLHKIFNDGSLVEVKTDRIAHKTGNIFIEYESRGKPSGIAKTTAHYWVYRFDKMDTAIIIPVTKLKDVCRSFYYEGLYLRNGGDNNTSKGFLIPVSTLLNELIK
jgi:hypothetical protein